MHRLRTVDAWAAEWQAREWTVATLPQELGVRVIRYDDGGELLGFSLIPARVIALDERLGTRPEAQDVLAHEIAHIIADPLIECTTGIELYHFRQAPTPAETFTWQVAGRLAVSGPQYADIVAGRATPWEIARINGVSWRLVEVGCAVHQWLSRRKVSSLDTAAAGAAVGMLCARLYALAEQL